MSNAQPTGAPERGRRCAACKQRRLSAQKALQGLDSWHLQDMQEYQCRLKVGWLGSADGLVALVTMLGA